MDSKTLYWTAQASSITKIRIKHSTTVDGTYSQVAEIDATDAADIANLIFEVQDTGYWKVYSYNGTAETLITSYSTAVTATPDSLLQRRIRRELGSLRDKVAYTDNEVREAYWDALLDSVNIDLGTSHEILTISDPILGTIVPIGVKTSAAVALDEAELSLLCIAAALNLLSGESIEHSRNAISADSPAGRINTTISPSELRAMLESLENQHSKQLDRILGSDTSSAAAFVEISKYYEERGYPTEE